MIGLPNLCHSWVFSDEEREVLNMELSEEEVHAAMSPTKSPGVDGFPRGFYQKVGGKLFQLVKSSLHLRAGSQ